MKTLKKQVFFIRVWQSAQYSRGFISSIFEKNWEKEFSWPGEALDGYHGWTLRSFSSYCFCLSFLGQVLFFQYLKTLVEKVFLTRWSIGWTLRSFLMDGASSAKEKRWWKQQQLRILKEMGNKTIQASCFIFQIQSRIFILFCNFQMFYFQAGLMVN